MLFKVGDLVFLHDCKELGLKPDVYRVSPDTVKSTDIGTMIRSLSGNDFWVFNYRLKLLTDLSDFEKSFYSLID